MVRESHDVDISNTERAAIANEAGADALSAFMPMARRMRVSTG